MALTGIKVVQFDSSTISTFCGMILRDFGASVIRVDQVDAVKVEDRLASGKMSIAVNLKTEEGVTIIKKLCKQVDVVLDPFRAGVMERLGIGASVLMKANTRLLYVRVSGYGDAGFYCHRPGHGLNFLAISGLLSLYGRYGESPSAPPLDFGSCGLLTAFGIVLALLERQSSNKGQVIDCNIVEGTAYLGSWLYHSQNLSLWDNDRGKKGLDTRAHFYETYHTKDKKFMAVAALKPKFYEHLLKALQLTSDEVPQIPDSDDLKQIFAKKFLEKTQSEWCKIFNGIDACVTPVLTLEEAPLHPHNVDRHSFSLNFEGKMVPNPAPKLSRTPATSHSAKSPCQIGAHTTQILQELNYSRNEIKELEKNMVVKCYSPTSKL